MLLGRRGAPIAAERESADGLDGEAAVQNRLELDATLFGRRVGRLEDRDGVVAEVLDECDRVVQRAGNHGQRGKCYEQDYR